MLKVFNINRAVLIILNLCLLGIPIEVVPGGLSPGSAAETGTDYQNTQRQYFEGLERATPESFTADFEFPFLLILNRAQKAAYQKLDGLAERKAFMKSYWRSANPNPLLPHNDWLLEFLRRYDYARENFGAPGPKQVDDRGLYYIKYGKPQRRYEDSGGRREISFFRRRVPATVSTPARLFEPVYSTTPHEVWSYDNVASSAVIFFIKEGTTFRETENLRDVVLPGKSKNSQTSPWLWGDLVKRIAAVSPLFGRASGEVESVEISIMHANFTGRSSGLIPEAMNNPSMLIGRIDETTRLEKQRGLLALPSTAYDPIEAENKLKFMDRISQFRNDDGTTRLEIDILSPLKKNLVKKVKKSSEDTVRVAFGGMLRDGGFRELTRTEARTELVVALAAHEKLPNAVGSLSLTADPQRAELTLQVKSDNPNKLGFSRRLVNIRDFTGPEVMISDIRFLTTLENENQERVLTSFEIDGLVVAAYPYERIRKSEPLLCYFEIYNLASSFGLREYELTYRLVKAKKVKGDSDTERLLKDAGKSAVSFSFRRDVPDGVARELIGINLKKISKGAHWLEIEISDPRSGSKLARSERFFVSK